MGSFLRRLFRKVIVPEYYRHEIKLLIRTFRREKLPLYKRAVLALILAFILVIVWSTSVGVGSDQWFISKLFSLRGPVAAPSDVALVAIDDRSYAAFGASPRWPFPRKDFANALEALVQAHPKVIILDLTAMMESNDPAADARIVAAMKQAKVTIGKGWVSDVQREQSREFVMLADPKFTDAAAMSLEMFFGTDNGMIWRLSTIREELRPAPSESYPLLPPLIKLANCTITPPPPSALINFYGPPGTIQRFGLHELLGEDATEVLSALHDKVVLVGFQSFARMRGHLYQEDFSVPVAPGSMYGAEIHATIAANLIDGSWIRRAPLNTNQLIICLYFFAIVFLGLSTSILRSWWIITGLVVLYTAASVTGFLLYSFFLPGAVILFAGTVVVIAPLSLLRALDSALKLNFFKSQFGIKKV